MQHWVELGILVLTGSGIVNGYLGGLRRTVMLAVVLLLFLGAALAFGQAGAEYLVLYHDVDVKIMPVLLKRLPLVISVSPHQGAWPDPGQRAMALVQGMPLAPVYKEWLAPQFMGNVHGLTEHHLVARVFSRLLVRRGAFLFFLILLAAGSKIISGLWDKQRIHRSNTPDRILAALLGGACSLLLISAVLTALKPFFPIFFGFVAWDVAGSPLVEFLVSLGLYILSGV